MPTLRVGLGHRGVLRAHQQPELRGDPARGVHHRAERGGAAQLRQRAAEGEEDAGCDDVRGDVFIKRETSCRVARPQTHQRAEREERRGEAA